MIAAEDVGERGDDRGAVRAVHIPSIAGPASQPIEEGGAVAAVACPTTSRTVVLDERRPQTMNPGRDSDRGGVPIG